MGVKYDAYFTTWHIVYSAIILPTVIGNGLILYSVWKFRRLRSNMHILIANLAVSDLIVGAILIPIDMVGDMLELKQCKYMCLATLGIFVVSLGSSCYNLLIISIERYIAIAHPLHAKVILSKPKMVFMISFGWTLSLLTASVPFYGVNIERNSSTICLNTTVWPRIYRIHLDWILTMAMILNFVFYLIVVIISVRKTQMKYLTQEGLKRHMKQKKDLHQVVTMAIVLGVFLICWLPYVTMGVVVTFSETSHKEYVKRCTLILGFFNSGINWLIYGYRNKDFRTAFKRIMKCKHTTNNEKRRSLSLTLSRSLSISSNHI